MKFYLHYDYGGRSRARQNNYKRKRYNKINYAIAALKTKKSPTKLVCVDNSCTTHTLMYFEGREGAYNDAKKKTLVQVGALMYVPKSIVRKTTRKRKTT